jgi:hypothetical protein
MLPVPLTADPYACTHFSSKLFQANLQTLPSPYTVSFFDHPIACRPLFFFFIIFDLISQKSIETGLMAQWQGA